MNWGKAEGDEVRGIGRPSRPWRSSCFHHELDGEPVQPFVRSLKSSSCIFKGSQRLSQVPRWKALPCVVGESEGCFSASVRGGVRAQAVAVQSRTNGCILHIF